ncbi:MAG: LysR family transcriptional regulator [Bdellovibrionales bacterium]|nr:LysR family transcriptional regulator [Bdellovibrionales bacterium]
MTPSFSDLMYFCEVAQTLNISRAAERLGLSQPSLSASMQRLETALGAKLLLRSRTGVQLTHVGKDFLFRSRSLISQWEQIRSETLKKEHTVAGQYSIGCHPSVGLYSLGRILPELMKKHPFLEIRCEHDLSRKIVERVISFEIDFGIVINPVVHPDLVMKELCTDTVLFWTRSKPTSLQNPKSEKLVLICDSNLTQVQKILSKTKLQDLKFGRILQTSSLELAAELVDSGVGVGIIPSRVVEKMKLNRLEPLNSWPSFKDHLYLVYRADAQKTQAGKEILSAIRRAF